MKLKDLKTKAIKFGASEFKRTNLLATYIIGLTVLEDYKNINIKDNYLEIFDSLKSKGFYKWQKLDSNNYSSAIGREMNLLRSSKLINFDRKNHVLKFTKLGEEMIKDEKIDFFGFTKQEYVYLLMLLKFNSNPSKEHGIKTFKNNLLAIKNEETTFEMTFGRAKKYITESLSNDINPEEIKEFLRPGSGTPGKRKDYHQFKKLTNKFVDSYIKKDFALFVEYSKENENFILKKFENFKYLFDVKTKHQYRGLLKNGFTNPSREEYIKRIINFDFSKKRSDYINLNNKHMNHLPFVTLLNKKLIFIKGYEELIESLLKLDDSDYKIIDDKEYIQPNELLEILKIKNNDVEAFSITKVLNNFITDEFIKDFFNKSMINSVEKDEALKFAKSNHHLEDVENLPTIFEFMVACVFFKNIYKIELKEGKNLNSKWKKSVRTIVNSKYQPLRWAAGGKADMNFEISEGTFIVEPTIQLENQTKMEWDSTRNHLKSEKADFALIVAPKINKELITDMYGENNLNEFKYSAYDSKKLLDQFENGISFEKMKTVFIEYINSIKK